MTSKKSNLIAIYSGCCAAIVYYTLILCLFSVSPLFLLPVNKLTSPLANSLLVTYFQILSTSVFRLRRCVCKPYQHYYVIITALSIVWVGHAFYRLQRFLSARLDEESIKIRKKSERVRMSKREKNTLILNYIAKERRKESTEIKEHKQKSKFFEVNL